MIYSDQGLLFPKDSPTQEVPDDESSTFVKNMTLPVHRWFRYSAGFSAEWVEWTISNVMKDGPVRVFDPFAGSATTLLAAESLGVESWGIDAHPFVSRIAKAKLAWRTDPEAYFKKIQQIQKASFGLKPDIDGYPALIRNCYNDESLLQLDALRQAYETNKDETPASELVWLTLIAILRKVSKASTAQWQYVLPKKHKRAPIEPLRAFKDCWQMIYHDMKLGRSINGPRANFLQGDARTCDGVQKNFANLVVTSPPYPNNFDYADATRLEMSFMREISGWGDLQQSIRRHLIRSCSQHVPAKTINLETVLAEPELDSIRSELSHVCRELAEIRESKGGKKTYHLMVACYFRDLAQMWKALRKVCSSPSKVCFVIGDSAPYGIYVPVVPWLSKLAIEAGFNSCRFEKTRDRNIKWRNRKHRVPLQEGRLWIEG